MGNINNVWYLKDGGGDWASTKCELDDCYSIPFDPAQDDNLYLQVAIPGEYLADEVWLCSPDGVRVQELLSMTEYKRITGENNLLIFKMPQNSMACRGMMEDGCFVDLLNDHPDPFIQQVVQDWVNGVNNTQLQFQYMSVLYPMGTPGSNAPLPPGFSWLNGHTIIVPCGIDFVSNGTFIYYTSDIFPAGGGFTFGYIVQRGMIPSNNKLNCWYLEIPLHLPESTEVATLRSEPFHCPDCQPTLKISSDYCLAATDIFGTFIFNPFAVEGVKQGSLEGARNDFRIQAVLKQLPSKVSASRNLRCNNFKSRLQQRYKLQGAMPTDFPDYMVNIIESIFSGKKLYIEGEEYMPDSEQIFTERNVAGRSMKKLDVELVKCERGQVFECKCVLDCNDGAPSLPFLIVAYTQSPIANNVIMDRTLVYGEVSPSGPYPPYTIHGFDGNGECTGANVPGHPFDPTRSYNVFRRNPDRLMGHWSINWEDPDDLEHYGQPYLDALSLHCYVTDSRGCEYIAGLTVWTEDQRCTQYNSTFLIGNPTPTSVDLLSITSGGGSFSCFDVSVNDVYSGYQYTGLTSLPFTIPLTPGVEARITIRVWCGGCPPDPNNPPQGMTSGVMGPYVITL